MMDHRYDFVFLFDVTDGNPNGDPDAGNLPRVDPETGHGLVTDVCLKRKVRNYIQQSNDRSPGFEIFVVERGVLNRQIARGYTALDKVPKEAEKAEKAKDRSVKRREEVSVVRDWMCQNFFDVRCFGGVMSTGPNAGQVRGPVQLTFARSIDPVTQLDFTVSRVAVTTENDSLKKETEFGRKSTVPYGMYRCHGFVNPFLARQTSFSDDDLKLFWKSLQNMFELDRSASRGQMTPQALVVFQHEEALGNAPAHQLQKRVSVMRKDDTLPARSSDDYDIQIDETDLPAGVSVLKLF